VFGLQKAFKVLNICALNERLSNNPVELLSVSFTTHRLFDYSKQDLYTPE